MFSTKGNHIILHVITIPALPRCLPEQATRFGISEDAADPGNGMLVTGLSARITQIDSDKYFSREGKSRRGMEFLFVPNNIASATVAREVMFGNLM